MRKFIGITALILVASISIFIYWNYMKVYSRGVWDGTVQNFKREGDVFKTYEGQMLAGGFGKVKAGFQAQYFYFSVEDPQVANYIEQNAGKSLKLYYVMYKKHLPWRGENYNDKNEKPGQYIVERAELANPVPSTNTTEEIYNSVEDTGDGSAIPY